jgi:ABC-type multidrug transport system permease subunit
MGAGFWATAAAIAGRHLSKLRKNPGLFMPALILPLCFFVAFAGGLSKVGETPDFGYPDYTGFVFVFVLLMGAAFCGVFTAFALAEDLETGFARRLLLSTRQRMGIVAGFCLAALVQAVLNALLLFGIGLVAGMDVSGSVVEILGMFALALGVNVSAALFAAGVALRLQSAQAAPLMIMPIFVILFLAPVYTPRDLLKGWLHTAAGFNPLTAVLEAARGFLAGQPESVALAFGAALGLVAVLSLWAVLGMHKAESTV